MLLALMLSAMLAALAIPRIVKFAYDNNLYDLPGNRKLHATPIPRLGGMCFLPIAVIVFALCGLLPFRLGLEVLQDMDSIFLQHIFAYVVGAVMLYVCGLIDDITCLGYRVKFMAQILAACSLCVGGLWIANFEHILMIDSVPFWVGMPFTVFCVVYLTNAMNLIDGIDGLASGLSCISLIVLTILNIIADHYIWALFGLCFLGPVATFFYFNVFSENHKIFMGDTGSLTLGFLLSFQILHFWQDGLVWNHSMHNIGIVAISTLVIPMLDVIRVMMSRLRDKRNPFLPDKNHIHHKLLRTGLSGHATMLVILSASLSIIFINFLLAAYVSQTLILVADIVLYVGMHRVINHYIYKREGKNPTWNRAF